MITPIRRPSLRQSNAPCLPHSAYPAYPAYPAYCPRSGSRPTDN